jgi:3(or 17)beta-hydroxysteroid dehydrogenase
MEPFKGKVALITGGMQGIGKTTALMLVAEGATVIISDIDQEKGAATAAIGKNCFYLNLDVQKDSDWKQSIDSIVQKHGKLDILINNAGVTGTDPKMGPQDPEHTSLQSWQEIQAINVEGVFLGCKYGIKAMKEKGGVIVNVSSRSGIVGVPGLAAYAASKAAVRNHTKSVALYCCEQNYPIRCNSVHPATILTPIWEAMLGEGKEREKNIEKLTQNIPMKKMGTPEDVANAIIFLCSEKSGYITGAELVIDGGILAGTATSPKKAN